MKLMSSFVLIACAVLVSGCVHPQVIGSYEDLRAALKPGDRVEVTASTGAVSGTVASISKDVLTIINGGTRRDVPQAAIARLEKVDRPWRRSAMIGLAIGGGSGAAIAGFSDCRAGETSCGGTRAAGIAGSALFGMGVGAAVGVKPRTTLIYVAPRVPQSRAE